MYENMLTLNANVKNNHLCADDFETGVSSLWCSWLHSLPPLEASEDERLLLESVRVSRKKQHYGTESSTSYRDVWLEIKQNNLTHYHSAHDCQLQKIDIVLRGYSAGSLLSPSRFCRHWEVSGETRTCVFSFDHNTEQFVLQTCFKESELSDRSVLMKIPIESVQRTVIVDWKETILTVILLLKHNPFISSRYKKNNKYTEETRLTTLEVLDVETVGCISALQLHFDSHRSKEVKSLLQTLRTNGLTVVYTNIAEIPLQKRNIKAAENYIPSDFETIYAWTCLMSRGPKVTDPIHCKFDEVKQLLLFNQKSLNSQ